MGKLIKVTTTEVGYFRCTTDIADAGVEAIQNYFDDQLGWEYIDMEIMDTEWEVEEEVEE